MNFGSRSILYLLILLSLLNQGCGQGKVPESPRSRAAIKRIQPKLNQELNLKSLSLGSPIFIRIFKESKELEVWVKKELQYQLFKIYEIHHFSGGLGPKLREGDQMAPEGFYYVTASRMNPNSLYHLSFNLGYPNAYDRAHGRTGSALMVHGSIVSIGCFAMTDALIEEIYTLADSALRGGQKYFRVHIFPFRMTTERLQEEKQSNWYTFWSNLKEGYQFFKKERNPPNTEVLGGRYVFKHDET